MFASFYETLRHLHMLTASTRSLIYIYISIYIYIYIYIYIWMYIYTGHDVNFCSDLPRRASEIQFSLALLQLSLALEKLYIMIL